MLTKEEIYALSLIKGIGNKSLLQFLKSKQSINELLSLDELNMKKIIKGRNAMDAIEDLQYNFAQYLDKASYELEQMDENGVVVITYSDDRYPQLYRRIENPPLFLFCKGNLDLLQEKKSIAVIGTRQCSETGYRIGEKTAQRFAEKGYNIVSGLAIGIDTAGHKGALKANGLTTAALVDIKKIYPKDNRELADQILENNGLLFAENRPGSFTSKGAFVARDRLQSGLSIAIFPIETDVKGGTMHTVKFAKEQGRLLFCPDYSKVNNYDLSFSKVRGIQMLLENKDARPYSSSNYDEVFEMIEAKIKNLFPEERMENSAPPVKDGVQGKLDLE